MNPKKFKKVVELPKDYFEQIDELFVYITLFLLGMLLGASQPDLWITLFTIMILIDIFWFIIWFSARKVYWIEIEPEDYATEAKKAIRRLRRR